MSPTAPGERNDSAARDTRPHKPRPKPPRRIKLLEPPTPDTDGWFALSISVTIGRKTTTNTYLAKEIPAGGMGAGCRGWELQKLDANLVTADIYHCLLHPDGSGTCDCMGYERHGHCKHREGIDALRRVGQLPACRSTGDFAASDPAGYAEWSRREAERWSDDYASAGDNF